MDGRCKAQSLCLAPTVHLEWHTSGGIPRRSRWDMCLRTTNYTSVYKRSINAYQETKWTVGARHNRPFRVAAAVEHSKWPAVHCTNRPSSLHVRIDGLLSYQRRWSSP